MSDEDYDVIIATAATASAVAAPLIIIAPPLVGDAPAVGVIWSGMIYKICRRAGHEIDGDAAGRLAVAVAAGAGTFWAGSKTFGEILAKIPFTMGPAVGVNALLNVVFTFRLGQAMVDLMELSEFDHTDLKDLTRILGAALRPRPSVEELQRAARLLRRFRGRLAG